MYHAHSFFFVIFIHLIFVNGTIIPLADRQDRRDSLFHAKSCPDGLPGRVTQIQEQFLARPGIFVTDCSPFRNNTLTDSNPFKISTFDKRQEQICSADCSNQCAADVGTVYGAPSVSDCENLVTQLKNRNTQFTVSVSQVVFMTYGTCAIEFDNTGSSPFIYCDTSWAARSTDLIDSCLPRSGGTCKGSQFLAVVGMNYESLTTAAPVPTPTTATTANGNGANTSSSVNGDGNVSNPNSTLGNTADSNTVSSSAPSGALLNGSQSRVSGSHTTTLSNGSVLNFPTASFAPEGSSETANQQSSTSSANIPAIVGAVLGLLLLALIILILLWRWKKRAQRQLAILEAESLPREFSTAQATNADSKLHVVPALGLENGANISETLTTEVVAGGSVWPASNKARMYTEEAMPGTSDTDLSSIKPSDHTPPTDSPSAPVYQIQSSSSRRESEGGRRGHRIDASSHGGSHDHPHPHPQQTGNTLSHHGRDAYTSDSHPILTGGSNSMSARTFAQASAPNLSASDIDRLAESIVARMQGRDPALQEIIFEESGSSIVTEDEPPPPWSAPGVDVHGL